MSCVAAEATVCFLAVARNVCAAWTTAGAQVVVPYRQNRLVMFNSNLIHTTDRFHFKPGYQNRRINLTLLFGARGA